MDLSSKIIKSDGSRIKGYNYDTDNNRLLLFSRGHKICITLYYKILGDIRMCIKVKSNWMSNFSCNDFSYILKEGYIVPHEKS